LHRSGTAGVAENVLRARSNESKKTEPIVTTIPERQCSNAPQSLGTESATNEQKKPPLLRLAALVRGGQTGGFINVVPSKVDRTKVSLIKKNSCPHHCLLSRGVGDICKQDLAGMGSRVLCHMDADSSGCTQRDSVLVVCTYCMCCFICTQYWFQYNTYHVSFRFVHSLFLVL
jgi:hypothetical protein